MSKNHPESKKKKSSPLKKEKPRTLTAGGEQSGKDGKATKTILPLDISPEVIGSYRILQRLGSGGMGEVYEAEQIEPIKRRVALKIIKWGMDTKQVVARFESERQALALMNHPNIARVFDAGATEQGRPFFAMEYVKGIPINEYCDKYKLSTPERLELFIRVCEGIQHAHQKGIIHRDLKPSNVMLTTQGHAKVLDFGLAKQVKTSNEAGLTKTGILFGTPRYIAPEAIYGNKKNDARADLYNLGGVAYWLLTGQPPFASSSSVELLIDHVKTVPERPSTLCEVPIPAELDDIIMKCLQKKPDDRFQCALELKTALARLPLPEPWDEQKAQNWWELHGLLSEPVIVCKSEVEMASGAANA